MGNFAGPANSRWRDIDKPRPKEYGEPDGPEEGGCEMTEELILAMQNLEEEKVLSRVVVKNDIHDIGKDNIMETRCL
ncbi:MAG: hypothetical protein LBB83_04425 [Treponema sp.]|nr:hypothetical protein [Treponema sp.]